MQGHLSTQLYYQNCNSTLCNAEPSFAVLGRGPVRACGSTLHTILYARERRFCVIPGVFGIALANRGIFGVSISTELRRES